MGRRRAGGRQDREDSTNRVVVSVGEGGGKSRYINEDTKEARDKMGVADMERKRSGRGIVERNGCQEDGTVQYQP